MSLKQIIEQSDTRWGRVFDLGIQSLIFLSLISFCVETLPDLEDNTRQWLYRIEVVTVAIFTVEYILRVLVADRPLQFIFSFYGLVDLVAIAPFYLPISVDLRAVRVLRFFRVFRVLKFARYTRAVERFRQAFLEIKEELLVYLLGTVTVVFLAAVGAYYFENEAQPEAFASVFHAFWWAIVTLTTVGYGDVYPITVGGRVFASLVLLLGLGIVAVPPALVASALIRKGMSRPNESATGEKELPSTSYEAAGSGPDGRESPEEKGDSHQIW